MVAGGKVFFAGGLKNNSVLSNKIDIYDLQTDSWSTAQLPRWCKRTRRCCKCTRIKFFSVVDILNMKTRLDLVTCSTTPTASIDIYDINGECSGPLVQCR